MINARTYMTVRRKLLFKLLGLSILFLALFSDNSFAFDLEKEVTMERKHMQDSPFGVLEFLHWNHQWNNFKYASPDQMERVVALMKEAGVSWVRMDFVWDDIEPNQGEFHFDKYDYIVGLLYKNNIGLLGMLDYSGSWASSCGEWNCPPKDNALFVNFAVKVVGRYKSKVKYWELWNEPDSGTYWKDQDGLIGYCQLLKEVYPELKKVDPVCKVLNGGFAQGNSSVNHLYDNGAKDYFDILNIHIFQSPVIPNSIKAVNAQVKLAYKIMSRNGDSNKELWITEIGCPGVKRGYRYNNWWMGKNPNERQQAVWLREVYTQLLQYPYVKKVFWAFFRDCRKFWDNGTDFFGIIRYDFSKKPAFTAYQKCVEEWEKEQ